MNHGYNDKDFETYALLDIIKEKTIILQKKLEEGTVPDDAFEKIEMLISVFNLDGISQRYLLEIGANSSSFYIEWNTPKKTYHKPYLYSIPEQPLLERAPVKWLTNLLLGVYDEMIEC